MSFNNNKLSVDENNLCCPHCGSIYIYHSSVEIFDRVEDAKNGTHFKYVFGDSDSTTADRCLDGNPSSRRDGLIIHFHCEDCEKQFQLTIAQHKGETIIKNRM